MEDWAVMVIAIVAISTIGGIVNRVLKHRTDGGASVGALERRVARLESLEARVQALEAIVTDPRHALAREIGDLERADVDREDVRAAP